jgi:hypothetical protein
MQSGFRPQPVTAGASETSVMEFFTPIEKSCANSQNIRSKGLLLHPHPASIALTAIALLALVTPRALPGFQAPLSFEPGPGPVSVAVGDYNSDGILDLAVANFAGPGSVSVLLGNGDGSFQPARTFATGSEPHSIVAGDFNGDGTVDLAVANFLSGTVSILSGKGDGTFQPATDIPTEPYPVALAAGDFNGDGGIDLAVVCLQRVSPSTGSVSVLLGNGDGSFQDPQSYAVGFVPAAVAVGDFNGDHHLDLAIANQGANTYQPGSVSVLLGKGDGTFQDAQSYAAGAFPTALAVGDLNKDGNADIALTDARSGTVLILLGDGDGTFQRAANYAVGAGPQSIAMGDFNSDGIPDLAVVNRYDGTLSILLGNGDGTFPAARNFPAGSGPFFVATGDFNGDSLLDVAVTNVGSPESTILLNDGNWAQ